MKLDLSTFLRSVAGKAVLATGVVLLAFGGAAAAGFTDVPALLPSGDEPTLQGKVVLKLVISPAGQVTDLRVVSSELHDSELERKLLARIRQFDFGAKDVDQMVVTWPVDFLPS